MNIIEPGIRNLATAKDALLAPYGLDEALLTRTLADIFTHRVDYADLYFQATRSEAWRPSAISVCMSASFFCIS